MISVAVKLKNCYTAKVNHEFEAIDLSDEVTKGEAVKRQLEMVWLHTYRLLAKVDC